MAEPTKQRTSTIFKYDLLRGFGQGIVETGWTGLAILIAIRQFDASPYIKSIIAASMPIGLLLNTFSLSWVARKQLLPTRASALFMVLTAGFFLAASFTQGIHSFTLFIVLAYISAAQLPPLMTHTFTHNYQKKERGQRLAWVIAVNVIAGIFFSWACGHYMDQHGEQSTYIFWGMALASLLIAWAIWKLPSTKLSTEEIGNWLQNIRLAWEDRFFLGLLVAWMFLGFSVLMTIPLRVEYLAQEEYGLALSNEQVVLLVLIIPAVTRVIGTHIWGRLFDKLHVMTFRIILNICALIGIIIFFSTSSLLWLGIATMLFGILNGGGVIIWSLWITKFSPKHLVAKYMSIHTGTTGIRGLIAPFVGYQLLYSGGPDVVKWTSASLMTISILIFIVLRKNARWSEGS